MITLGILIDRVINEGIEAVKKNYDEKYSKQMREAAIAGFEACRGKSPEQLVELYREATRKMSEEYLLEAELMDSEITTERGYWYYRCFQDEVEYVVDVVSAVLENEGQKPLLAHHPSEVGYVQAVRILSKIKEEKTL